MKDSVIASSIATLVLIGTLNAPASADDDDVGEMQAIASQLGFVTPEEASAKALSAKPGVVTDVDLDDRTFGNGWDYEFEIIDATGKEWDVYVDARTGEVRKVSRDWF